MQVHRPEDAARNLYSAAVTYVCCSQFRQGTRTRAGLPASVDERAAVASPLQNTQAHESVLLSSSESVLLSCSNSPSWPNRSRGLVSVVTVLLTHKHATTLVSVAKHSTSSPHRAYKRRTEPRKRAHVPAEEAQRRPRGSPSPAARMPAVEASRSRPGACLPWKLLVAGRAHACRGSFS